MLDPDAIALSYWNVLQQPAQRLDLGTGIAAVGGEVLRGCDRRSGAMQRIEPGISRFGSGPSDHPGMTKKQT
jgi:hypothetical protein